MVGLVCASESSYFSGCQHSRSVLMLAAAAIGLASLAESQYDAARAEKISARLKLYTVKKPCRG